MTCPAVMWAVRAEEAGEPGALRVSRVPLPRPATGELLVQVHAAAVNRSDVLACRGVLPVPFPRTLGRDFAGEVIEGPSGWVGRRVWGTGGRDIGFSCDGSHAEVLVVPARAVCEIPAGWTFPQAAASALSYFTAFEAWELAGGVEEGSTVVVTGAVGGVGSAATCLAASRGARVIGVILAADQDIAAQAPALDVIIRSDLDDVAGQILKVTGGEGADRAVDTVGGPLAADVIAGMAVRGRICILSTPPPQAVAGVNLLDFHRRELRLAGLYTGRLTAADAARALSALADGFSGGALRPTRIHATYRLGDAPTAYHDVERGVRGRPVFVPGDD